MQIGYVDSAVNGYWRSVGLRNNTAALQLPTQALTPTNITPDVKGMGLKDAVYLLENKGLKTIVSGRGRVVDQSILAGTGFIKGQKIILMLN